MRNRAFKGQLCLIVGLFLAMAQVAFASKCVTDGIFQDMECSPGAVFPECGTEQICTKGYTSTVRNVPQSLKDKVFEDYGIPQEERKNYVIDHICPLQLCGNNSQENLFPQRREPYPNSKDKDKIETYLKKEVCKGELDLNEAQEIIRNDWLSIFEDVAEQEE